MTEIKMFADLADRFYALYFDKEYKQALDIVVRESPRFPDYSIVAAWWQMRMMALTGDVAGALHALEKVLAQEQWYHEDALHNIPDLAALQGIPKFEDFVARCRERRLEAVAKASPSLTVFEPKNHPRPWPLLIPLGAWPTDPNFAAHWAPAADEGWLVAIPQSSQVGWYSGLYVWDDIERTNPEIQQHYIELNEKYELDKNRVVTAGFSKHCQAALQVALNGNPPRPRGFIAVEAWLSDMSIWPQFDLGAWPQIIEANANPTLRCYFVAGEENTKYYEAAEKAIELLRAQGIACKLEGTANKRHGFPPEFEASLKRALDFILKPQPAPRGKERHHE
jgi:predicted esterase